MMNTPISRRGFLKGSLIGLGAAAFRPFFAPEDRLETGLVVRVGTDSVSVYSRPDDESTIVRQRYRDELINVYYEVISDKGPSYNPLWYRVWGGYMHSAHLPTVETRLNPVVYSVPETGQIAEVTVPITEAYRPGRDGRLGDFIYGLYYQSTHWIVGVEEGPDGEPWYRLRDELLKIPYLVRAEHLRPIPAAELTPLSPEVPMEKKRVDVSISGQTLTAYEDDKVVLHTKISSGVPNRNLPPGEIPTHTPVGSYKVFSKMPSKHMGDGNITVGWQEYRQAYELPGVPWVSFFEKNGVAFHGTWWHNNFGIQMSHGCVNMRTEEAKWLYRWLTPAAPEHQWETRGWGTLVNVF